MNLTKEIRMRIGVDLLNELKKEAKELQMPVTTYVRFLITQRKSKSNEV